MSWPYWMRVPSAGDWMKTSGALAAMTNAGLSAAAVRKPSSATTRKRASALPPSGAVSIAVLAPVTPICTG